MASNANAPTARRMQRAVGAENARNGSVGDRIGNVREICPLRGTAAGQGKARRFYIESGISRRASKLSRLGKHVLTRWFTPERSTGMLGSAFDTAYVALSCWQNPLSPTATS